MIICKECKQEDVNYAKGMCLRCYRRLQARTTKYRNKQKEYYDRFVKDFKAYSHRYYIEHKDYYKKYMQRYYLENKDKMDKYQSEYYKKNSEEINRKGIMRRLKKRKEYKESKNNN